MNLLDPTVPLLVVPYIDKLEPVHQLIFWCFLALVLVLIPRLVSTIRNRQENSCDTKKPDEG